MRILPARWLGRAVHLYTASGVLFAFLAAVAVNEGDHREAFLWLFAATVVDATDGWLARLTHVGRWLPGFSGDRLDDIVDYLTFVFLPTLLLYESRRLPTDWSLAIASVILLSSVWGFSRTDAKTDDHFFTGFPSYWNIVAFYLYAADTSPAFNAVCLLALCGLVFVPIGYVYPSRTPILRPLTLGLCTAWGVLVLVLILQLPAVSRFWLAVSLGFPLYYAGLSLVLHRRRTAV